MLGQPGHLSAQNSQRGLSGGQLLCRSSDEQLGVAVLGQSRDMAHAVHIQFRRFSIIEMVTFPLAPFAVALGESRFAGQADTFAMPECRDEINPFLASIGTIRAGEQFVCPWKGLVSKRNEIVLQRHHILHVEIVLARAELQLFSNRFHRGIFPQIYPVVKSVLGDFHSVCFVSLDLADGTSAALLDEQWVYHGHADTVLMQRRRHWLMIPARGLHERPGIFPQRKDVQRHPLKANLGMRILLWLQDNLTHWPQGRHHAFSFRYVNSYCVHDLLLCD